MWLPHFEISGQVHLGGERGPTKAGTRPTDLLFHCAECGSVYARVHHKGPAGMDWAFGNWFAIRGRCEACPSASLLQVPGSVWLSWDDDYLASLPDAILACEVRLHLQHFAKDIP